MAAQETRTVTNGPAGPTAQSRRLSMATPTVLAAVTAGLLCLCLCALSANAESPRLPDLPSLYDRDPLLPVVIPLPELPPSWKQLWLDALQAEEVDLRRAAAISILREHQRGNPSVEEMAPPLLESFNTSDSDDVRLAVAAALIELDDQTAAQPLAEYAKSGPISATQLIEPALAQWRFAPYSAIWLQRLQSPDGVARQRLSLAIDCVQQAHLTEAAANLHQLVFDPHQPPEIRIPAADALGHLQSEGLLDRSIQLASDTSAPHQINLLLAVKLLSTHKGPATEQQLLSLAAGDEPAVITLALQRLLELNPQAVHPLTDHFLSHPDGDVRRLAAESLVIRPEDNSVDALVPLLNDPHPAVRSFVRQLLADLAQDATLNASIREQVLSILNGHDWRGQEQAARLLAELDEDRAAERLVELLAHDRPEVRLTAAWSLRELAVDRVLPAVHEYLKSAATSRPGNDAFTSYLLEWIGKAQYSDAVPLLTSFVPKNSPPRPMSRTAAIWALGRIYDQQPDETLRQMLSSRITDDTIKPYSEHEIVRASAAVALGRMGDEGALPLLQSSLQVTRPGTWLQEASRWAIEQITGDLPDSHGRPYPGPRPLNPFLRALSE